MNNKQNIKPSHAQAILDYNAPMLARKREALELLCAPNMVWLAENRCKLAVKIINNIEFVDECWIWQGPNSGENHRGAGYGRITACGSTSATHRVAYVLTYGWLPAAKQVDHICENRLCCNPNHLEAVTHKQNQRRRRKNYVRPNNQEEV